MSHTILKLICFFFVGHNKWTIWALVIWALSLLSTKLSWWKVNKYIYSIYFTLVFPFSAALYFYSTTIQRKYRTSLTLFKSFEKQTNWNENTFSSDSSDTHAYSQYHWSLPVHCPPPAAAACVVSPLTNSSLHSVKWRSLFPTERRSFSVRR